MQNAENRRLSDRWVAVLIGLILFLVWKDTFWIHFRNDHWWYLHYIVDFKDSLWDLLTKTYSFPRVRDNLPICRYEFRPLTHAIIAINQWLFGGAHAAWQFVSLMVHALTTFFVYFFSRRFLDQKFSFVIATLFGVCFATVEMVSWSHIVGYNIFILLIAYALVGLLDYIQTDSTAKLRKSIVALTFACLFNELGNFAALAMGFSLWWHRRKQAQPGFRIALLYLIPIAVFSTLFWADYFYQYGFYFQDLDDKTEVTVALLMRKTPVFYFIASCIRVLSHWYFLLVAPFFNDIHIYGWHYSMLYHLTKMPYWREASDSLKVFLSMRLVFSVFITLAFTSGLIYSVRAFWKRASSIEKSFSFSVILTLFLFCAAIFSTRMVDDYLKEERVHYAYLMWMLLFLVLPLLLKHLNEADNRLFSKKQLVLPLLCFITLENALSTQELLQRLKNHTTGLHRYLNSLEKIIEKSDKKDRFALPTHKIIFERPQTAIYFTYKGNPEPDRFRIFTPASLLFSEWIDQVNGIQLQINHAEGTLQLPDEEKSTQVRGE